MAITKLHPIKTTLNLALDYITDSEKSFDKNSKNILISSFNCSELNADFDFYFTKQIAKQVKGDYDNVGGSNILAWHIIQSFSSDDNVTIEEVHELGKQLADEFLQGKYQYVLSTHLDKDHLHNHIIFNSTSFVNYKKFDVKRNAQYLRLREISNKLCREKNLSTIELPNKKNYIKNNPTINKNTYKYQLKLDINKIINHSINFDNFIDRMKNLNYEIKEESNSLSFRHCEQKYFTKEKSLGSGYSKNEIMEQIKNQKSLKSKLEKTPIDLNFKVVLKEEDLPLPITLLKSKLTWKSKLKYCIDYSIFKSNTFDEFLNLMKENGYKIKYGKHIAFSCDGMEKNIRAKVFGEDYTEENIKIRLKENNKQLPLVPVIKEKKQSITKNKTSINKRIETVNNEKYKDILAYKKWVEKYNADQTLNSLNFLRRNNLTVEKLQSEIHSISEKILEQKDDLKTINKDIAYVMGILNKSADNEKAKLALNKLQTKKDNLQSTIRENQAKLREFKTVNDNLSKPTIKKDTSHKR